MANLTISNICSSDSSNSSSSPHPAHSMDGQKRQDIALAGLTRIEPIKKLADDNHVSRKFVYTQMEKAGSALQKEFEQPSNDEKVLFWIPVTKEWLQSVVVALLLDCHSSFRGVISFFADILDESVSLGTIHNIVKKAVVRARAHNNSQDLSKIHEGAHDELFQGSMPVLTGIDLNSLYCYLLAAEQQRDAETWAIHLLNLENQGLHPERIIADAGKGLRAGQALAWPGVPCYGDHFHAFHILVRLTNTLDKKAYAAMEDREKTKQKMTKAKKKSKGNRLSKKFSSTRNKEANAVDVADNVRILVSWLCNDILTLNGMNAAAREELYDFVADSLRQIMPLCEHRIKPVWQMLVNQRNDLLAFAHLLDKKLNELAQQFQIHIDLAHQMLNLLNISSDHQAYWQMASELKRKLGSKFYSISQAIGNLKEHFHRTSSLVENLNSRLRTYFFLRRQIGADFLDLLQFFLNHTPFMRSERQERRGKSPAELLLGRPHSHWLEMLGFSRFRKEKTAA